MTHIPDEAVEKLSESLIGPAWATFDEGLLSTLRGIHREALEAALPYLACSCLHISDVDDNCPQHGRDVTQ